MDNVLFDDNEKPFKSEITAKSTKKKMDKDRFRQDLGNVIEAYKEVGERLGINFA